MSGAKVARNTAYLVTAFVGQKVLAFAYFIVVARWTGVEGTGRYFLALAFTTMFSIFVDLGLSNVVVRETAKFPERAKDILATVLGIKTILAAFTVAATLTTAWMLDYSPAMRLMITLASAVMVLDSFHLVFYAAMRGFQNLRYEAIGVVSGQAVTMASGLIFIALKLSQPWLIAALFLGSSWNVIWSYTMLRRVFGVTFRLRLDRPLLKFLWSVTVPFALAGIFSRVYSYIDSVMLSKLGTETAVGLYGAAYKLTFAFQFLPMAFSAAIYPAMSEYYVKDRAKLAAVFGTALKYLAMVALPVSFGIAALAAPILDLIFGPAFAAAVVPLEIIVLSLIAAYLYWPAGSLLNACDRQGTNTLVMGVTMLSNIALNAVLIPRLGAVGAAIAALCGNTILFAGALIAARKIVPYDLGALFRPILRIALAAAVMAGFLLLARPTLSIFALMPLGAAIYIAGLFLFRSLTFPEARNLIAVFLRRSKGVSDLIV